MGQRSLRKYLYDIPKNMRSFIDDFVGEHLGKRYGRGETFTIEAKNVSRKNKYVQSATLNGKKLDCFFFPASELLKGGELILEMGDKPNESWGIYSCPVGVNR